MYVKDRLMKTGPSKPEVYTLSFDK